MQNITKNNINFFNQDNDKKILNKIYKNFNNDKWINGKIVESFESSCCMERFRVVKVMNTIVDELENKVDDISDAFEQLFNK